MQLEILGIGRLCTFISFIVAINMHILIGYIFMHSKLQKSELWDFSLCLNC